MSDGEILAAVGLALIAGEMLVGNFILFGMGGGALGLAAAWALFGGPTSWTGAVLLWAAITGLLVYGAQKLFKKKIHKDPDINRY